MLHFSRNAFDKLVEAAIDSLPPAYARWLEEVPVIVEDRPSKRDLQGLGNEEEPLGLYVGDSIDANETSGALPARVMLYRLPLMEACESRQQLAEEIRKTLLHELGHHAGMDESDLDGHGMGDMEDPDDIEWDMDP